MRMYAGIDLAAKGKHEVFVLGQDGEVLVSRYRFAMQAEEIDHLRGKVKAFLPDAEIWWISEPTGTQWVTMGQYLLGRSVLSGAASSDKVPTCLYKEAAP